jgi:hypothetical protein
MKQNLQAVTERTAATISTENLRSNTVGLDLGDRWSRYCVLNRTGEIVEEDRVRTTAAGLEARFASMPATRVVIEVGGHSPWVSRPTDGLRP